MVFSARQVLEKCRKQRRELHIAFIDLSKAFDSVDRELLWKILEKSGCPPIMLRIIKQLHDDIQIRVKVAGDLSEPFSVSRDVKQGCTLAPVLFNTYVQCITRLLSATMTRSAQININFRTERNLFSLSKLKAKSKVSKTSFSGL